MSIFLLYSVIILFVKLLWKTFSN